MYVSCSFDDIYQYSNFDISDLDLSGADLKAVDAGKFGITRVSEIFPAEVYLWNLSISMFVGKSSFIERLFDFYGTMGGHTSPPCILVSIQDSEIYGSIIYCNSADNRAILYETHRPADRAATNLATDQIFIESDSSAYSDVDIDYFHLGSAGSFNYGHWLIDDLPRAAGAVELSTRNGGRRVTILLPKHDPEMNSVREISLRELIGSDFAIEFYPANRVYKVPRLYFASPVSLHPVRKSPSAIQYVASGMQHLSNPDAGSISTRIFILRTAQHGRTITNLPEVIDLLDSFGFLAVNPATLSFQQQVGVLSSATIVVGIMGAAMSNTLFCAPETPVVYLAPEGWIEPFYLDLAATRHQQYRVIYGPAAQATMPSHLCDFHVPLELLKDALEQFV